MQLRGSDLPDILRQGLPDLVHLSLLDVFREHIANDLQRVADIYRPRELQLVRDLLEEGIQVAQFFRRRRRLVLIVETAAYEQRRPSELPDPEATCP